MSTTITATPTATTGTESLDPVAIATTWAEDFRKALDTDPRTAVDLFEHDGYWRDLVSFTWNITTAEGKDQIADMLATTLPAVTDISIETPGTAVDPVEESPGVVRAFFTFTTPTFTGRGVVRLREGKIFTLLTTARGLVDFPEPAGRLREQGAEHGAGKEAGERKQNWADKRAERQANLGVSEDPYVLIVGGGQGGIALAARLKRQGVPTLVVDKHARPGDQWRSRYHSLCLHDPVWYDHLPYLPFPDHWPIFTPKDKMGDWLEAYVSIMDLDYWSNTEVLGADFDEGTGAWQVRVNKDGKEHTIGATQLVLATGMSGVPNMPTIEGADTFGGEIRHSSQHPGGAGDKGKTVVVLGANNSAHDICADLYDNGAHPVMIQRSSTHIVRSESLMREVFGPLYSEDALEAGIDTDTADLMFASWPYRVLPEVQRPAFDAIREADKDFYAKLEKAGFLLDFGDDDSGLFLKYLRRASGYYIDVGASELIADGKIELHSGVEIGHLEPGTVVLTDGTTIAADVLVCATGFGSMSGWAAKLISQDVADKVGPCWGLGSDTAKDPGPWVGELRNMWKPTRVENLWFHGGNLHQSRHYSRYVALQLKARFVGLDTPVYEANPNVEQ